MITKNTPSSGGMFFNLFVYSNILNLNELIGLRAANRARLCGLAHFNVTTNRAKVEISG